MSNQSSSPVIVEALRIARAYLIEEAESESVWSSLGNAKAVAAIDAALGEAATVLELLLPSNLPMENDPDVLQVARAIAERGIGRYWDDFPETDAFDTDQGDLIEYARAAVEIFRRHAQPVDDAQTAQQPDAGPVAATSTHQSAPDCGAPQNIAERDPSVMPDLAGADTLRVAQEYIKALETKIEAMRSLAQPSKVLNINATVKVKLTEVGTARWRGKHNVTRTELELPLWELMAEFGPGLHMGMSQMYFVDNEIKIC